MAFLQGRIFDCDLSANSLLKKCSLIAQSDLEPGDMVFSYNGKRAYHVGVYMGVDQVIEAKGRDVGVAKHSIHNNFWNRFGRLDRLREA